MNEEINGKHFKCLLCQRMCLIENWTKACWAIWLRTKWMDTYVITLLIRKLKKNKCKKSLEKTHTKQSEWTFLWMTLEVG